MLGGDWEGSGKCVRDQEDRMGTGQGGVGSLDRGAVWHGKDRWERLG